ncbi:MAG: M20/M25/M40 family metallo-hydrolase [Candidatus Fermentibacteraceae bacterium]|nr:M20/M25/M40 family metallo-hydrolase [Candidatus Fermentibacteraceae bacterium]
MIDREKVEKFAHMIEFRTVSGKPGSFEMAPFMQLRDYLRKAFPAVHENYKREIVSEGSLLYTLPGSDPSLKPIMLTAHLDVVPAEDGEQWPYHPFKGSIENGQVWGRGSLDYKIGVAGMLQACEDILNEGFLPARSILLAFGHDEETGGMNGAAEIVRLLRERDIQLSSVLDEGGYIYTLPWLREDVAVIGLAEKGYLTLRLIARSEQGHASVPGIRTAAGALGECLSLLEKHQIPVRLCDTVDRMFQATEHLFIDSLKEFASLSLSEKTGIIEKWSLGNAFIRTTTATTMLQGSSRENVLSAAVSALVNFRSIPGDNSHDIVKHVKAIAFPLGIEVEFEDIRHIFEPSAEASMETDDYRSICEAVEEIWPGLAVVPGIFPAATDSRHYGRIADNVYRFVPAHLGKCGLSVLHSEGESVSVEDYLDAVEFYTLYIRKMCGGK